MSNLFFTRERSIVPALDCELERAIQIVQRIQEESLDVVEAFKLGSWKGTLRPGLDAYIQAVGPYLGDRKLIYDHQKAGADIPDLEDAVPDLLDAGVHAVIFFPFGGAETQERWTAAAQSVGLHVMVGLHMTQKRFLWSEGGYVHDDAPELAFRRGARQGVRSFVFPGNKPEFVEKYRHAVLNELAEMDHHDDETEISAPGFVDQGGEISRTGKVAGRRFHTIVGRDVVNAADPAEAVRRLSSGLVE